MTSTPQTSTWTIEKLGALGVWSGGGTPSKSNPAFWEGGTIPWVSPKDMKFVSIDDSQDHITESAVKGSATKILPKGSLLVVTRSGILQHSLPVATNSRDVTLNQDIKALTPKDGFDVKYLYFALRRFGRDILHKCCKAGTTVQSIEFPRLKDFEIPIAPLPEQRRIVARIEELFSHLDAGVAALRHAKAQLQRYRQSVLTAAVTGQLTQEWREQHPETESAGETVAAMLKERKEKWERKGKYSTAASPSGDLYPLPEKWCWATWDQLSHWVTYGFTRPMDHVEEGIPIVTAKHVKNSRINYDEGHRTPYKAYDNLSEKDRPQPGDILVTKDGTIGRAAIVESDTPFCINQSVAVVWLRTCPMYRKYLLTTIETESAQRQMTEKARGVAIKHLSITDFARMNVPIPPLAEQHRIVAEVESRTTAIDHLEAELDRQISRSNRLRQSTLAAAFSGSLLK